MPSTLTAQFLARCSELEVVQALHKITLSRLARDGWISGRVQDKLGLFTRRQLAKVPQELKEPEVPRQVRFADAAKHPQVRLE